MLPREESNPFEEGTTGAFASHQDPNNSRGEPDYPEEFNTPTCKKRLVAFDVNKEIQRVYHYGIPTTYFTFRTRVEENQEAAVAPDVPAAPYLAGLYDLTNGSAKLPSLEVTRAPWTRGSTGEVKRRYSELVLLRKFLQLQFPHLFLPPLHPKSSVVENVETTFGASETLKLQRVTMQLFLNEISTSSAVMFFSPVVVSFFLDTREMFESSTLKCLQTITNNAKERLGAFRSFSLLRENTKKGGQGGYFSKMTQVINKIPFIGTGGDSGDSADEPLVNDNQQLVLTNSCLPNVRKWVQVMLNLQKKQRYLHESSKTFEKLLVEINNEKSKTARVVEKLKTRQSVLLESGENVLLRQLDNSCRYYEAVMDADRAYVIGKQVNVVQRLAFERLYLLSALQTIDRLLCLSSNTNNNAPAREYVLKLNELMEKEYESEFKASYKFRMANMVHHHLALPLLERSTATAEAAAALSSTDTPAA
ncbi:PX domain containing protein, putative [Angomonas deanei]|uniref:PX domain containing protein, putative n=1 Tax=Angomonas deanei TaxID=59799 RepID=A0A7G2CLV8_9TRYP|nr:PX domain containing protein, putative [Angomonas deanei]